MIRKLILLATLCVVTVFATNVRPVTVNGPPGSEQALQTILNSIYGCTDCVSADNDQSTTYIWQLKGTPPKQTAPMIEAVNAAAGNAIGIYTNPAAGILIFTTASQQGSAAALLFNADGTMTISDSKGDSHCVADGVNCGTFSGINQHNFGFLLATENDGGHTYYTDDSLNGGTARALTYTDAGKPDGANRWSIAFEDGSDFDYNDKVMSIESITPIPEPASVVLFGTLLVLCASGLRRRRVS